MTDIDKMLIPDNVTGKGEDRRMKRFGRAALAVALASSMAVTPVFAAPDTDELESSKAAAQSEADSLQEQLTELLNKAGELEEEMISTGEKIIEAQADLEEAQQKADEQYASMKVRIQYMYENGQATAIETLLSATDFSDFVNKAEYISNVHTYDRQQLQALEDTEKEIQDLKTTLEEEQKKQESMQEEYEAQEAELNATLEEKKAEIADYDQQIQAAAEAAAAEAAQREAESQSAESSGGSASNGSGSGNSSSGGGSSSGTVSGGGSTGGSGSSSGGASSGNTSTAQAIINAAYSQLGVPYVYGGSTAGVALDCSGLVQYCHAVAGISLPRTSQAQGGCGVAVSSPQPGDIVCYGTHVGIYIGNGQMIHAPKPGDVVKIASVYGSPWYRRCW